jgi:hypothetical protein
MTHDIVQTSAADTLPPFDPATFWTQFHHDTVALYPSYALNDHYD